MTIMQEVKTVTDCYLLKVRKLKLSWYIFRSRNLSFLKLKSSCEKRDSRSFSTTFRLKRIFLVLFWEGIKTPLLADLIWIRPKGIGILLFKPLGFCKNNDWLMENMDKGLTLPKRVLMNWTLNAPKSLSRNFNFFNCNGCRLNFLVKY